MAAHRWGQEYVTLAAPALPTSLTGNSARHINTKPPSTGSEIHAAVGTRRAFLFPTLLIPGNLSRENPSNNLMAPYKGGKPAGHVAGYDGKNWISDFIQRDFWAGPGYRTERPSYAVYRP